MIEYDGILIIHSKNNRLVTKCRQSKMGSVTYNLVTHIEKLRFIERQVLLV